MMRSGFSQNGGGFERTLRAGIASLGASWKSGLSLVTFLAVFAFATNAQAVYVDFEASATAAGQMEVGGVSMTITTETREINLGGVRATMVTKTFSFDDGPVMLSSVDIDNDKGMTLAIGMNGLVVTHGAGAVDALVSRISTTNVLGMGELAKGVNVNVTPTSAVPEPGAALLFSAGLAVVGVTARRQR